MNIRRSEHKGEREREKRERGREKEKEIKFVAEPLAQIRVGQQRKKLLRG